MVEVSLTVGKLDASLALLLTKDHHLIEFPTILLPNGVKAGSIVKIRCDRDLETEEKERQQFRQIQDEILATYGKNLPQNPILRTKNVTQTSCVLAWDPLDLGTATLKSLVLYKDGKKLGAIPNPLNNNTTKLSGLSIDKTINLQLRLDSTAGIYSSETIEVTTHKMTDLSGINVCLGDISPNGQFSIDDIQDTLKNMGAFYPASNKVQVETTHFIATRENKQNEEYIKANEMNIPVIRPEWLKACERERRIVGVRDFYVKDCVLPDIMSKDYWKDSKKTSQPSEPKETAEPVETKEAVEADASETTAAEESSAPVPEAEKVDDEPVRAEKLSPKVEADPAGADEVDLAGPKEVDSAAEQTEENTDETKETTDSQIIEPETTEPVPEKESSLEEQPEVEVQSTQAVVEPNDLAYTEALDEKTPKNESSLPNSKEFEKRDISLENVAEDETDTPDAIHSDTPEGATAGVTDVKENAGTIEAKQEKEKSPTSLEDVEI